MVDAISNTPSPSPDAGPSIDSLTQFVRSSRERDEAGAAGRNLAAVRRSGPAAEAVKPPRSADNQDEQAEEPLPEAPDGLEPDLEALAEPAEDELAEPDEEVLTLFGQELAPDIAALDAEVRERLLTREREVTRVLQGAAERFRGLQDEARSASEANNQLLGQLQALQEILPQLEASLADKWAGIDWQQLARENPEQYWQYRALHDEEMRVLSVTQEAEQRRIAVAKEQFAREERAKIVKIIPDFGDPEKARAHEARMRATAQRFGVSQDTYDSLNASEAALLHFASLYLEGRQQAAAGKPQQALNAPARVAPRGLPGRSNSNLSSNSRRNEQISRAQNRVQKEGSIDSLVDLVRLRRGV